MTDIGDQFTPAEKKLYIFLEIIKKNLYDNKHLKLRYTNEDVYFSKILEYFYDTTIPIDESVLADKLELIDFSSIFTIYPENLTKIILEIFYTETMFMNNNYKDLDYSNINEYDEIKTIYNEIVDDGLLSGTDVQFMLSESMGYDTISRIILMSVELIKSTNIIDDNILFMGWINPNRIAFTKFKTLTKEELER